MTTLTAILAAHGTSPDTVSLTGPATRLGDVLDDAFEEHAEAWQQRAWDTLRDLKRTQARAEAAEARHRRHLLRLRWRAALRREFRDDVEFTHPNGGSYWEAPAVTDRLFTRDRQLSIGQRRNKGSRSKAIAKAAIETSLASIRDTAKIDLAGPFPGDKTRPPGRLP